MALQLRRRDFKAVSHTASKVPALTRLGFRYVKKGGLRPKMHAILATNALRMPL